MEDASTSATGSKRCRGGARPGAGRKKKQDSSTLDASEGTRALTAIKPEQINAFSNKRALLGAQLLEAAENGEDEVVRELLDDGADVNFALERGGNTVLSIACHCCNSSTVELLVENGADVNKYQGQAIINALYGAKNGKTIADLSCLSALIRAKADVNLFSKKLDTPLHVACDEHCPEAIIMLHSAGSNVDIRGDFGRTPLFEAAFAGSFECFKLLHELGARLDAVDLYGKQIPSELNVSYIPEPTPTKTTESMLKGRIAIIDYMDAKGFWPEAPETRSASHEASSLKSCLLRELAARAKICDSSTLQRTA